MTLSLKHSFQSTKGDGTDATQVQPSHWNAEHTISCAANSLIGRGSTAGAATEIACTALGRSVLAANSGSDLAALVPAFPSGTVMLFAQTAAPTGWTKITTHDNKALRVVSGTASSGGTVGFTSAFTSQAVNGTVGNTTLTIDQIPAHTHSYTYYRGPSLGETTSSSSLANTAVNGTTGSTGGGQPHTHTFTGTAINLAVSYVDVILASKD